MFAPIMQLRLLAQYHHIVLRDDGDDLARRKEILRLALLNCEVTRDLGTEQMNVIEDRDLREDICEMRGAALTAIPLAEAALRAESQEEFTRLESEFVSRYANVKRSVKAFLWDAGPVSKRCLWPLVDEVM